MATVVVLRLLVLRALQIMKQLDLSTSYLFISMEAIILFAPRSLKERDGVRRLIHKNRQEKQY